ncbi:uncharacterized protein LOC132164942 [Corylus avellana]|uniref:uncharacterized protein LOC132164942 n=1 Tax=Corylus avellana TaxID=13451 RepID=UPI00286B09FE|nr:uncharacterized protein LOC132164942 [Corylus avellana]
MAIVLRFVDKDGFIQEHFFDIVHVKYTPALTLNNGISDVLSRHCLDIQNIREQGYDVLHVNVVINYKLFMQHKLHIWKLLCLKMLEENEEIVGITDVLCQVLQQKSQDILNAINSVSIAKKLIQKLRDDGCDDLLENIVSFSKKAKIDIPDLSACYIEGQGRSQKNHITLEHHYHFDIFNTIIDFQLQELDNRFSEKALELLILSSALNPKYAYKSFKIDDICILAEKYHPLDFSEQDKINLRYQLRYFELDVLTDPTLQNLSFIAELCQGLAKAKKSKT